jgi:hypothetical protein
MLVRADRIRGSPLGGLSPASGGSHAQNSSRAAADSTRPRTTMRTPAEPGTFPVHPAECHRGIVRSLTASRQLPDSPLYPRIWLLPLAPRHLGSIAHQGSPHTGQLHDPPLPAAGARGALRAPGGRRPPGASGHQKLSQCRPVAHGRGRVRRQRPGGASRGRNSGRGGGRDGHGHGGNRDGHGGDRGGRGDGPDGPGRPGCRRRDRDPGWNDPASRERP